MGFHPKTGIILMGFCWKLDFIKWFGIRFGLFWVWICGRIWLFYDTSRVWFFGLSLTETLEVSGSLLVARITKSRPSWGSRLVVTRALSSLLPWFDSCESRLLAVWLLLLPRPLWVEWVFLVWLLELIFVTS